MSADYRKIYETVDRQAREQFEKDTKDLHIHPSATEHIETLWACACGHQWFDSPEPPQECPSCHIRSVIL